ncbi:hypothetical protein SAMN02910369_01229 [Lachnospiraceae bacterium NE2001]|nr:hypothetical protein SAMN02910369_01229 [Lachnospiraceae bacterium NE2001]
MKSNMTERDKKLLVGMFIGVIIVAIGYWGILPQVKQYRSLAGKIEKEEDTQKINKQKLLNVGTIEIQADNYEQKIAERRDEFYPIMTSSEIDRMMTEMAVGHGLNVYDLSFNMPNSPTSRMAYKNSSLYTWQVQAMSEYTPEDNSSSSDSSTDLLSTDSDDEDDSPLSTSSTMTEQDLMNDVMGGEEGGYQPNTDIYAVPVTITVGGDLYDLEQFIDEINTLEKRALLLGYSWGEFRDIVRRDAEGNIISSTSGSTTIESGVSTDDLTDVTVEVITRKSLTVRLEIYMCDTTDVATSTDATSNTEE